jgi:aromatic-L-amino-acid/L-tryptophan decarboxylase
VLAPVPLQTLCILHKPEGLDGEALDRHTHGWADRVNRSGGAYLTPAILCERWIVRVSIGSITTERQHVQALWELIQREVRVLKGA